MKRKLIGTEVNIDGKEGEITNVLGNGYEIVFFDTNLGKTYIDNTKKLIESDNLIFHLFLFVKLLGQ